MPEQKYKNWEKITTDLVIIPGCLTIPHVGSQVNETFKVHLSGSIAGTTGWFFF